jgi:hypothetical protein
VPTVSKPPISENSFSILAIFVKALSSPGGFAAFMIAEIFVYASLVSGDIIVRASSDAMPSKTAKVESMTTFLLINR